MDILEALKVAGEQTVSTWNESSGINTKVVKGNDKYDHIYLQVNSIGELNEEEALLSDYFGLDKVTLFYPKDIEDGTIIITNKDFVSGEVPTMQMVFDKLGINYSYCDYPETLRKYMHRNLWTSTVGDVKKDFVKEDYKPIFVKPKDGLKKFTGFTYKKEEDIFKFKTAPNDLEVWCCEPVRFISEYRIPVINGKIRDCCYYSGERFKPDMSVVEEAVKDFKDCNKAYCIDFGVLDNGETTLIEVNDAYAIGCYTMSAETYGELLTTRWDELLGRK